MEGYEIHNSPVIHHMNPIMLEDVLEHSDILINPEYLITVSYMTHQAIHYGDKSLLREMEVVERRPNDTSPWKQ